MLILFDFSCQVIGPTVYQISVKTRFGPSALPQPSPVRSQQQFHGSFVHCRFFSLGQVADHKVIAKVIIEFRRVYIREGDTQIGNSVLN